MHVPEPVIDPDRLIVDPHHHLWDRRHVLPTLPPVSHPFDHIVRRWPHYMLEELRADMGAGHRVVATVYLECGAFYRSEGPAALKPVGETEVVNGVAAQCASGVYGDIRACAGIVGTADLTRGAAVAEVLDAHIAAGGGRFRGVRYSASWDKDPAVLGPLARRPEGVYREASFREGFAELAPRGLSFDAWMLEPQLPDLIDLAGAFPDTPIVLDHVGTPLGIASYAGRREERFPVWRDNIHRLAEHQNVVVKLGGLAMPFCGFASCLSDPPASSEQLADEWRPWIETCIEAFGAKRAMFESNFPVDQLSCDYRTLWNALKRVAAPYPEADKQDLFFRTAERVYRLDLSGLPRPT
jgi:predicted TIM-barrel fold metal-dependent hydrolase